jgi:hypothetical protein
VNHKRLHRAFREAGLAIRRRKHKHCVRQGGPLVVRPSASQEWGKPAQNARVESFRGRLLEECLNLSWFRNLFDARGKIPA